MINKFKNCQQNYFSGNKRANLIPDPIDMRSAKRERLDEDSKPEIKNPDLPDVITSDSSIVEEPVAQEVKIPETAAAHHSATSELPSKEMASDESPEIQLLASSEITAAQQVIVPESPKHDLIILEKTGQEMRSEVTESLTPEEAADPRPDMQLLILPDVTVQVM